MSGPNGVRHISAAAMLSATDDRPILTAWRPFPLPELVSPT